MTDFIRCGNISYMSNSISIATLRKAYKNDPKLVALLDWAVTRKNNAFVTSLDVFERELGLDRAQSVELAKHLESLDCAVFKRGRKGWKSRVEWRYGLFSLADAFTSPSAT